MPPHALRYLTANDNSGVGLNESKIYVLIPKSFKTEALSKVSIPDNQVNNNNEKENMNNGNKESREEGDNNNGEEGNNEEVRDWRTSSIS